MTASGGVRVADGTDIGVGSSVPAELGRDVTVGVAVATDGRFGDKEIAGTSVGNTIVAGAVLTAGAMVAPRGREAQPDKSSVANNAPRVTSESRARTRASIVPSTPNGIEHLEGETNVQVHPSRTQVEIEITFVQQARVGKRTRRQPEVDQGHAILTR